MADFVDDLRFSSAEHRGKDLAGHFEGAGGPGRHAQAQGGGHCHNSAAAQGVALAGLIALCLGGAEQTVRHGGFFLRRKVQII